jgi:tRNA(Arg) A34 adenosine deaminase TadA
MISILGIFVHMSFTYYMKIALEEAKKAQERGEVPIGAVLVSPEGTILAQDGNRTLELSDPTAHAEMVVIRKAASLIGKPRLLHTHLYVTLEPCPMCAQAISFARIQILYYGAYDPKGGGVDHGPYIFDQSSCFHKPKVFGGVYEEESQGILQLFFKSKRKNL